MDKEFLNRLRLGDGEAFRALVETYQDKVINTCFRFLHHREDAEDTAQDVFVEVYRSLSAFREEAGLSTWIYRIAVTKSLDVLRKKKRKKRFETARKVLGLSAETDGVPASAETGPEQSHEIRERSRILQEKISELAENQRVAIVLSSYEGLANKEIAEILGTTVPAVDSLIHRAKKNLKKKLFQYYENAIRKKDKNEAQA